MNVKINVVRKPRYFNLSTEWMLLYCSLSYKEWYNYVTKRGSKPYFLLVVDRMNRS